MKKNIEDLIVLVVHENRQMRGHVRHALNGLGVTTIVEASELEMGFNTFKFNRVDLVISDYRGETVDGVELTKRIREGEDILKPPVPVILLTVENLPEYVDSVRDLKGVSLLTMSFDAKALYASIKAVFQNAGSYVISAKYAGPDRRSEENRPTHNREHRRQAILDSFLANTPENDEAE